MPLAQLARGAPDQYGGIIDARRGLWTLEIVC
jgi:hypothetical protein